jgi:hypothetical protein
VEKSSARFRKNRKRNRAKLRKVFRKKPIRFRKIHTGKIFRKDREERQRGAEDSKKFSKEKATTNSNNDRRQKKF